MDFHLFSPFALSVGPATGRADVEPLCGLNYSLVTQSERDYRLAFFLVAFLAFELPPAGFFLGDAFFLAPNACSQFAEYWLFEPLCNTVTLITPFLLTQF